MIKIDLIFQQMFINIGATAVLTTFLIFMTFPDLCDLCYLDDLYVPDDLEYLGNLRQEFGVHVRFDPCDLDLHKSDGLYELVSLVCLFWKRRAFRFRN